MGQFTVFQRVSDLVYVVDFPGSMRLDCTVIIAFLKECEVSPRCARALDDSAQSPANPTGSGLLRGRNPCRWSGAPAAHLYAVDAILEALQREKRGGREELQYVARWQDS